MFTISYVEMVGFRGFRNLARFDFPKGFAVLNGRNGAGKSTVFDAIDFVFTGSINKYDVREAKGGGLEEHLWWVGGGAASDHYVAIGLKGDDGKEWEIRRIRDGSLVGEDFARVSNELCQHSDQMPDWPHALIRTSLIRDELIAAMSLDLTEQARFAAVRAALGTSDTSSHLERFRKIVTSAESAKTDQENRHTKSHEALGRLLTSLTEMRSLAQRQEQLRRAEDPFAAELGETWRTDPKRLEAARSVVSQRRQRVSSMRSAITEARRLRAQYQEATSTEFLGRLDTLRREVSDVESRISQVATDKEAADQALSQAQNEDDRATTHLALLDAGERIGLLDGACPLCSSNVSAAQFIAAVSTARALLAKRSPAARAALAALEEASRSEREMSQRLRAAREALSIMEASREQARIVYDAQDSLFQGLGLGKLEELAAAEGAALIQQERLAVLEQALSVLETSAVFDRTAEVSARVDKQRIVVDQEALRLSQAELAVERAKQMQNVARVVRNEMLSEQLDIVLPLLKELYLRLRPHADWREIEIDVAGQVRASLNLVVGWEESPVFV